MSQRKSLNGLSRKETSIPSTLDKSLTAYAAVAGAGLLAIAQPLEAKVVFTPTHQTITSTGLLKLDLNADGVTDFTVVAVYHTSFAPVGRNTGSIHPSNGSVTIYGAGAANQIVEATSKSIFAKALAAGAVVSSKDAFAVARPAMEVCGGNGGIPSYKSGQWLPANNKFLGLKFTISGQTHFGWARFSVKLPGPDQGCQFQVLLSGYAYETVANKPIIAGKTKGPAEVTSANLLSQPADVPSLGILARGTETLAIWRRKEEEESA